MISPQVFRAHRVLISAGIDVSPDTEIERVMEVLKAEYGGALEDMINGLSADSPEPLYYRGYKAVNVTYDAKSDEFVGNVDGYDFAVIYGGDHASFVDSFHEAVDLIISLSGAAIVARKPFVEAFGQRD